jgi:hypothetical protein
MQRKYARLVGSLFGGVLVTSAAVLGFSACEDAADDCRNTRSCAPDYCIEAGDALDEVDGC